MTRISKRSTRNLCRRHMGYLITSMLGVFGALSACSAESGDVPPEPSSAGSISPSPAFDESARVTESLRVLEDLAVAVEHHVESNEDPELSSLWEAAASVRSDAEVDDFIESLRAPAQHASIDLESQTVITYLNALAPLVAELEQRSARDALAPALDAAYARFVQLGGVDEDVVVAEVEKKKRPHCCTFQAGGFAVPLSGCIEVNDNDFNSFFECLGEIGSTFSMSRGSCNPATCAFIDYE